MTDRSPSAIRSVASAGADAAAAAPPPASTSAALSAARRETLVGMFDEAGPLARNIPGYRPRQSQQDMAMAVAAAIEASAPAVARGARGGDRDADGLSPASDVAPVRGAGRGAHGVRAESGGRGIPAALDDAAAGGNTLIVEAGTGTGKTYAYLVPAMLWGGKVIVSTGTKHLQDQLYQRDIPTVRDALGVPVTVAMLKGRANYVCHYYLNRTADSGRLPSRQDASHLSEVVRFAKITRTGDKAELASVPENAPVWPMVTSTRENCLGQECPNHKDCFVMQARREAQQADVVVVNHHLFFADILLRDTGMAELLPTANTVIFDEAHQLPETATLFFGETVSTGQLLELARDTVVEGLAHARDGGDWRAAAALLERTTRDVRLVFPQDVVRLSLSQLGQDHPFHEAVDEVESALAALVTMLAGQAERAESLANCLKRARELQDRLVRWRRGAFRQPPPPGVPPPLETASAAAAAPDADADVDADADADAIESVRWVEVFTHTVQLHQTPLSVAPIFTKQRAGVPRAWVFTSATLSVKNDFAHYAAQMGLPAKRSMTLPSPFDYARQGLLYVPQNLPQPSAPNFTDAVFDAALPVIEAARGRCFFLCTTLRAVDRIAKRLAQTIQDRGWDFPLLVQGVASRTELLDRFRHFGNAILVGSQSFWEGVDVRGDALSLVIIDKLPFSPPDDPVLAARLEALAKKGLSPFAVHQLPQAVITLKQGAGRLIRSETDRGVLMICDPRLVEKPYGRRIWQSLPPFLRTREADTVKAFLDET